MKYLITILMATLFTMSVNAQSLEDFRKVEIDCSTDIIKAQEINLSTAAFEDVIKRRTNFAIPMGFVKEHFLAGNLDIMDQSEISFGFPKLNVVAEGVGDYKFKDTTYVPITNVDGTLRLIDTFGQNWPMVSEEDFEKYGAVAVNDVRCYLVN